MSIKKTNYESEYFDLSREQYKRLPNFSAIMRALGLQVQEIENAIFQISDLNTDFGISATLSRDSLNKTAEMFGIKYPSQISSKDDLVLEIRAAVIVAFSRCRLEDLKRLPMVLFGFKTDIIETGDGVYVAIFGDLVEKQFNLLFRSLQKLMPAGNSLHGIIQNNDGWVAFQGFTKSGTWRSLAQVQNDAHRLAQLAVNSEGNYLL